KKNIGKTVHCGLAIKKKTNHIKKVYRRRRIKVMVNVLFFAELKEAVGNEKLTFEADGMSVKDLKKDFLTAYDLENIDHAMIAVNEEYAKEDTVLKTGDVVAFIPPVSGG